MWQFYAITVDDSISFNPTLQFSMIKLRVAINRLYHWQWQVRSCLKGPAL